MNKFAIVAIACASIGLCSCGSSRTPAASTGSPSATGSTEALSQAECKDMIDKSIHLMTDGVNGDAQAVELIRSAHQAGLDRCTSQGAYNRGNYDCVMGAKTMQAYAECKVDFISNVKI